LLSRSTDLLPQYLAHRWILTLIAVAAVIALILPSREQLAFRLLNSGQVKAAKPLLEGLVTSTKSPVERAKLHQLLGSIATSSGDPQAAIEHARQAVQATPDALRLHVEEAWLHELCDRPLQAMESLLAADRLYSSARRTGKPSLAAVTAGLTLLAPSDLPLPGRLQAALDAWYRPHRRRLAALLVWHQKLDPALNLLRELCEADPNDLPMWAQLERLEAYAGDRAKSRHALEHMAQISPEDGRTWERLGVRAHWERDPEAAARFFKRAKLDPAQTRRRVIHAYVVAGQGARAVSRYLELFPEEKPGRAMYRDLAEVYYLEGRVREAAPMFAKLVREFPNDEDVQRRHAELLLAEKKTGAAVKVMLRLIRPERARADDIARACAWIRDLSPPDDAVLALEAILAAVPGHPKVRRDLGIKLVETRHYERAVELLEEAVARQPGDQDAAYYLGSALGELGRTSEAVARLKTVIRSGGEEVVTAAAVPATRPVAPPQAGPVSRRVLALHKRSEKETPVDNLVHQRLEVVLNHLGLVVDHRAIEDGLPTQKELAAYRGVVTWFQTARMTAAPTYLKWLDATMGSGVPVMILDGIGAHQDENGKDVDTSLLSELQRRMAIEFGSLWTDDTSRFKVEFVDRAVCESERPLAYELDSFTEQRSVGLDNQVLLRLKTVAEPSTVCDAVITGPWGALVHTGYVFHEESDRRAWRVDPFELATRVFKLDGMPRLDVTTRVGKRLAYVHIDGDGSDQPLEDVPQRTCLDEFVERVMPKRNFPHTVSLIARLVDPQHVNSRRALETARRLMAHPTVEPAHHSYSHPLDWTSKEVTILTPGYKEVELDREVEGARTLIDREICPPDKKVKMMLWSGQCNPTEEALALTEKARLPNLNGGDPMMDAYHPSVSHLAPLHRVVGNQIQSLTSGANDYVYTDRWTRPRFTFANLIETFRRTETPRRLSPVNLYYHFYLLAEPGGRVVLDKIYDWIETQDLHFAHASDFVAAGAGFRVATIERLAEDSWKVSHAGECRTVRFDRETRQVDMARSSGVVGHRRADGTLWVHLAATDEVTIVLARDPTPRPHVMSASVDVREFKRTGATLELIVEADRPGSVRLSGGQPGAKVPVGVAREGVDVVPAQAEWSAGGDLDVAVPGAGRYTMRIGEGVIPRTAAQLSETPVVRLAQGASR
jgi:tetratricopeptide (TPR) repeat protein